MSAADVEIHIRAATAADEAAIADLHAESWLRSYRGTLSDAYLDGPMRAERAHVWRQRLAGPETDQIVLVAMAESGLVGFVCLLTRHDAPPHNYIDNLHVSPALHGQGIGRRLLAAVARAIPPEHADTMVSLTVFEANKQACAFYEAVGGRITGHLMEVEADGRRLPTLRYAWSSASALRSALSR